MKPSSIRLIVSRQGIDGPLFMSSESLALRCPENCVFFVSATGHALAAVCAVFGALALGSARFQRAVFGTLPNTKTFGRMPKKTRKIRALPSGIR
jgi:hypothetical protein